MRIAVIGWGSLIWCPGSLQIKTRWRSDGPGLPIEFARISGDGRLTLVIHPGSPDVHTYWALSAAADLDQGRQNLRVREGCNSRHIHSVTALPQTENAASDIEARVRSWLLVRDDVEAAIWTALPSNWGEKRDRTFTSEDAVLYLRGLEDSKGAPGLTLDRAREYVTNAPAQIQTPVRKTVRQQLGWEDAALSSVLFERDPDEAEP